MADVIPSLCGVEPQDWMSESLQQDIHDLNDACARFDRMAANLLSQCSKPREDK